MAEPLKTASILAVNPNTGMRYGVVAVQIVGDKTHFGPLSFVSFSAAGITPSNVVVTDVTHISATLTIAPDAALVVSDVTVTTGSEVASGTAKFTVQPAPPATISAITPASAKQYDVVAVEITGHDTHFDATTFISFSAAGITPSNVVAIDGTHLSATLTIAPEAALGACDVTAVTGAEVAPGKLLFAVQAALPATISVSPDAALRGTVATMQITGVNTHFGAHTVVSFAGEGITVSSRTVLNPTTLNVTITMDETAELRTSDVLVTSGPEVATGGTFTVQYNPALVTILRLDPGVGTQGATDLLVQIHGQHTNWDVTSVVSFAGQGITLSEFHLVDLFVIEAMISIDSSAEVGYSDVTVTTGPEVAHGEGLFLVMVSTTKAVVLREAVNSYLRKTEVKDPTAVAMCEEFIANVDQATRIAAGGGASGVLITVALKGVTP